MSTPVESVPAAGPGGAARQGQFLANGMLEDNYPRNMWWVAAHSREVTEKPLARWLLETPVVLYRLADGTPAALYDRCVPALNILLEHGADVNRLEIVEADFPRLAGNLQGVCIAHYQVGDIRGNTHHLVDADPPLVARLQAARASLRPAAWQNCFRSSRTIVAVPTRQFHRVPGGNLRRRLRHPGSPRPARRS